MRGRTTDDGRPVTAIRSTSARSLASSRGNAPAETPVVPQADRQARHAVRTAGEPHLLARRLRARTHPERQLAIHAGPHAGPPILDAEVRMRAASMRPAREHAMNHSARQWPLHLQRHPPVAAPGRRHRHATSRSEGVDEAEPRAVRHPVAFVVAQDRQEHGLAGEPRERPHHRVADRSPRPFPHHDDERDPVGGRQRTVPLADLDRLESTAGLQPCRDGIQIARRDDVTDPDAGERQDLLVGDGVVAVDPDVHHRLRQVSLRERAGHDERERERDGGRREDSGPGAARSPTASHRGRSGPTDRMRPPVSASR